MNTLVRPERGEFAEYYGKYIDLVPEGNILEILSGQLDETRNLLTGIKEERGDHRYAPGKWSIKGVVGHVIDSERVFAYRALRFSRGDRTPLPGFEQDDYVERAAFERRTLRSLIDEFASVRTASLTLFQSWDEAAALGRGFANACEFSARSLPFMIAGHERHHMTVLKDRYL